MSTREPHNEQKSHGSLSGADSEVPSAATETGGLTTVRCSRCDADVVPTTPNHCPQCGGWVQSNIGALTHGLRSKKAKAAIDNFRAELLEQLFVERGGRDALDLVSRVACENYALACAQLKVIEQHIDEHGVFTQGGKRRPSYDMLVGCSATIDRLRAQLPPLAAPRTSAHLDKMPASSLRLAADLLRRQIAGESLTERELGQLDILLAAAHGDVSLPPQADLRAPTSLLDVVRATDAVAAVTAREPASSEPAAEAMCGYGCGTLLECAEIKATRIDAWRALHYADPDEVHRRNQEATAVMYRQISKPTRW